MKRTYYLNRILASLLGLTTTISLIAQNVGINITNPQEKLHIGGDVRFDDTHPYLHFYSGSTQRGLIGFWSDGNLNLVNMGATSNITFGTNSVPRMQISSIGNVGIGTSNPLSRLSIGADGNSQSTIYCQNDADNGIGVYGKASATGDQSNWGGFFIGDGNNGVGAYGGSNGDYGTGLRAGAAGAYGRGVYSSASGIQGYGVQGRATGTSGIGVSGNAINPDAVTNYGGHFISNGSQGRGVYGWAQGQSGYAVYGKASNDTAVINYGGYFEADGTQGRGVFGYAPGSDSLTAAYGGYFLSDGKNSKGVYGLATGESGSGISGKASYMGTGVTYGGFFTSEAATGIGVYGFAPNSGGGTNYGGYFKSNGALGRGVYILTTGASSVGLEATSEGSASSAVDGNANFSGYGITWGGRFKSEAAEGVGVLGQAMNSGDYVNYGGYFEARGTYGIGIQSSTSGALAYSINAIANGSNSTAIYGGTTGNDGKGVYGYASGTNGKAVVGHGNVASTSYDFDAVGPGVNYGATSSIRWKKDIIEIDHPLEKLSRLRGVYFNWDAAHGGHHDVGMIAEEVGKVLPEIVVYEPNGVDADGMDYSKLTPLLIEVTKAQQKMIEDLTKEIAALKQKMKALQ